MASVRFILSGAVDAFASTVPTPTWNNSRHTAARAPRSDDSRIAVANDDDDDTEIDRARALARVARRIIIIIVVVASRSFG